MGPLRKFSIAKISQYLLNFRNVCEIFAISNSENFYFFYFFDFFLKNQIK